VIRERRGYGMDLRLRRCGDVRRILGEYIRRAYVAATQRHRTALFEAAGTGIVRLGSGETAMLGSGLFSRPTTPNS
jgi:hypothetical protein